MTSKLFAKHFKHHILKYTVGFSAAVHLIAFYFFSTWNTFPTPDREKVIKVKYVLETKVKPEEKKNPEFEKKIKRVINQQEKTTDINRPNLKPKSAIIRSAKVVPTPPHSAKRNPVPIRNSEKIFKPVNSFQYHSPNPYPVAEYKRKAQFEVPQAIRPTPRLNRDASQKRQAPVALSKRAMLSRDEEKSFQRTPQITRTSSSMGATIPNSAVQRKNLTKVTLTDNHNSPSLASSTYNGKISLPKTTAVQKLPPVELEEKLLGNQPVPEIKNLEQAGLQSLRGLGQAVGIQAQAPQSLGSEVVAQNQPVIPVTRNYFSSPFRNTSIFQMASIPWDFSEEILDQDEKVSNRAPAKTASLGGGVGEVSAELLGKIKKGFSSQVWSRIAQFKYYPRIARDRGFEGQPVVAFTLGNRGELLQLSLAIPSPFKLLDEAALDAVKSASPYPPIPELLNMKSIRFKLPISFILEEQ